MSTPPPSSGIDLTFPTSSGEREVEGDQKFLRGDEAALWHWGEGNKYVIEGGKSLFWLNGGAAAGMLTFIGNERVPITCGLRAAIFLFAVGSASAAALFTSAYIAQLNYGKVPAGKQDLLPTEKQDLLRAERWHRASYASAAVSLASFVVGVAVAALSL
jgi:hypothetical protein